MKTTQTLAERNCRQQDSLLVPFPRYCGVMPENRRFWIGLKRVNGTFRWSDDTYMSPDDQERWRHGDPSSYGDCVVVSDFDYSERWVPQNSQTNNSTQFPTALKHRFYHTFRTMVSIANQESTLSKLNARSLKHH
ncbi:lectin C-type domain protein [Oesophagostomum dentatum]|uniref:Lectin C-type domain protein n=1 Tax=Oesophagostomum dentatum TaxID=61180 RepID=A0A0B1SGC2_OESDE|nr:lectin C-type domain protein [Oesophagostomum dentatum]